MNTTDSITQRTSTRLVDSKASQRSATPRHSDVEAWLLDLGLRAVQVEHCPIPDCEACGPTRRRTAA